MWTGRRYFGGAGCYLGWVVMYGWAGFICLIIPLCDDGMKKRERSHMYNNLCFGLIIMLYLMSPHCSFLAC